MTGRVQDRIGSAGLQAYFATLETRPAWRWVGRVVQASGQTVESEGPLCSVGESCEVVDRAGTRHAAEVIGFRGTNVVSMPLNATQGNSVWRRGTSAGLDLPSIAVGEQMQGRILERARRKPLDGRRGSAGAGDVASGWRRADAAMDRAPICEALQTGHARDRWNADGRDAGNGWESLADREWVRARSSA